MATMLGSNPVMSDVLAAVATAGVIFAFLGLWKETAKHGLDQKLNRKLVHISIGLVFMLCWPLFSSGHRGAILAALTPGINIFRMLLLGLGILKDEATVKSMSRFGDHRELLKGPLYYALTITLACAVYWRTSPVAIAAICNLCAGDGIADVVGRRLGKQKLPYNRNKSIAGSISMFLAGFVSSVLYMYYFASFGYLEKSYEMVLGFLVVSLGAAFVESLPISTELDDNLTVTVTSVFLGSLIF
ncbi:probable phytol kinase 3, chloroplastic isoform X2 [Mercurialis annua]|uniref:probable phytol kinase 3, chloroplastic isoform X2 n=1 Tax=Mercurialis annua TaxID=3986 RepID=UPI0021602943|nr:probable phytol kinase 3, chloroplastic isoform X2 [Mercurialis annua]